MAVRLHRLTIPEFIRLTRAFLFTLVLGIAIRRFYPCTWWLYDISRPFADACIIAAIIGISLEVSSANLLINKVGDSLIGKLKGDGLPEDLQGHIVEIVKTSIVRSEYFKTYDFSDPVDQEVKIDITASFEVRNFSEENESYLPAMDEEEFFKPEFQYLEYGLKNQKHHVLTQDKLRAVPKFENTRTMQVSGDKKITLKPIHWNREAICSVTWKYRVTMPEEFCEVNEFRYATLGAKFQINRIHPGFKFCLVGDNMEPRAEESILWQFKEPFITGQQVRAQWVRQRDPANKSESDQT